MLSNGADQTGEYKIASQFCKTVKDNMVKTDIAKMLSARWNTDIQEVRNYIDVRGETTDELLGKMHGFDDSFADMRRFASERGIGLGFKSIDESLGGVKRQEIAILGAYTNHGKSFIASKIVAYRILHEHDNVLIFSMEMPRGQFLNEIVKEILGVNDSELAALLNDEDGFETYNKVKSILDQKLLIVDEPNKTMEDVYKFTQVAQANDFNVDFVVFDHFHLIPNIDDIPVLTENANKMKDYVKHFNVTLLMLAQFNEESQSAAYGSAKKRYEPILKNLKGANALKAIADVVLLLWRPYKTDTQLDVIDREAVRNISAFKIGKSRRSLNGQEIFKYEYNWKTSRLTEVNI